MVFNNPYPGSLEGTPPPPPYSIPKSEIQIPTIEVTPTPTTAPAPAPAPAPAKRQPKPKPLPEPTVELEEDDGYIEEDDEDWELNPLARVGFWLVPAFFGSIVVGFVVSPRGLGTLPKQVDGVTPPLAGVVGWAASPLGVGIALTVALTIAVCQRRHTVTARIALLFAGYVLALGCSLAFTSAHAVCPT